MSLNFQAVQLYDASMIASIRAVCLIPGLPKAWYLGNPHGLVQALAFTWCASLLLIATFVWPAWLNVVLVRCLWPTLIVWWLWESLANHWTLGKLIQQGKPLVSDNRFQIAQDEYLRGNWFEAEAILLAIVTECPRDVEAHLLLVSVLRHTRRWGPALRRLQHIETLDASAKWQFEISRERQFIQKLMSDQVPNGSPESLEHQESTCEQSSETIHSDAKDLETN